jgi:hypothetical protein
MNWIRHVLGRRDLYDGLSADIRAHLDEKVDALVASGMSRADAMAEARRAFGNVTAIEEAGRDVWQWPVLDAFAGDFRYALRQLRRTPGVAAIIIATLAIGIAATTTVFSWTRTILLDSIPGARHPAQLFALETTSASGSWTPTSWLDYRDFRTYLKSFTGLAAAYPTTVAVSFGGGRDRSERHRGELVSANFFDVLQVQPAVGQFFPATSDDNEGARPTVVISHDLWMSQWHGDTAAVGSTIEINRFPFTIIGVAPAAFHGSMSGQRLDVWIPAAMLGQIVPTGGWWLRDRGTRTFRVLARLRPGVTFGAARPKSPPSRRGWPRSMRVPARE